MIFELNFLETLGKIEKSFKIKDKIFLFIKMSQLENWLKMNCDYLKSMKCSMILNFDFDFERNLQIIFKLINLIQFSDLHT